MLRCCIVALHLLMGGCALAHERAATVRNAAEPVEGRLSASWTHACFVTRSHALYCWGTNENGQLGIGTTEGDVYTFHVEPVHVDPDHEYRSVSAGVEATCAIRIDGTLACWGRNRSGVLGTGDRDPRALPVVIGERHDWRTVEVGSGFACGIHDDASMDCWGEQDWGWVAVDDDPLPSTSRPTPVPGRYTAISSSWYRMLALSGDGALSHCENDGMFTTDAHFIAERAIATGVRASLIVDDAGDAWALDSDGVVMAIAIEERIVGADASYDACVLTESGRVLCCESGSSTMWTDAVPREIMSGAVAVAVGASFACALDAGDTVRCWSPAINTVFPSTPTALVFE